MSDTVKIVIDDVEYEVPKGQNLVDVAKWHADNDIPVFCYHPKMDPVGMCMIRRANSLLPRKSYNNQPSKPKSTRDC